MLQHRYLPKGALQVGVVDETGKFLLFLVDVLPELVHFVGLFGPFNLRLANVYRFLRHEVGRCLLILKARVFEVERNGLLVVLEVLNGEVEPQFGVVGGDHF